MFPVLMLLLELTFYVLRSLSILIFCVLKDPSKDFKRYLPTIFSTNSVCLNPILNSIW